jgi:hypothetical protein
MHEHAEDGLQYLKDELPRMEPEARAHFGPHLARWQAAADGHRRAAEARYPGHAPGQPGEHNLADPSEEAAATQEILERQGGDESTEELLDEYTRPKALRHRRR